MRVVVFPSDNGGCGHYRLIFPARQLQQAGHDLVIADPAGHGMRQHRRRHADGRDVLESIEVDGDVLVMQRIVSEAGVETIAQAKEQGLSVVVDVDDDLDSLHPQHPYRDEVGGNSPGRSSRNLHLACQLADLVTVTTQPLADRYAPHGRYAVLPNLVPERYLRHRRVKSRRVQEPLLVGWTGRPISHIGDTAVMARQVGPTVAKAGARFAAWGQSADRTFHEVAVPVEARRRMPFRDLRGGYPQQVAKLDVGLVPLQDSEFNRAKSWLKGAEYSALGVPWVASPLPEYVKLHKLGAGLLAATPAEWVDHVVRLLASPRERADLAEAGRAVMVGLTYEQHSERWWEAWTTMAACAPPARIVTPGADAAPPALASL